MLPTPFRQGRSVSRQPWGEGFELRTAWIVITRLSFSLSDTPDELPVPQRREQVARLALLGQSTEAIAAKLGAPWQTIGQDLELIHGEWRASAEQAQEALTAQELARLDHLEREYWAAWDRSIAAHSLPAEAQEANDGKRRANPKDPLGDPRYLDGVEWCIERRCKLLGLDAGKKIETSPDELVKVVAGIDMKAI